MFYALNRIRNFDRILGRPEFDEKGNQIPFLAAIDRFLKYPTACIFDKTNGLNVTQFSYIYFHNHGVPQFFGWIKRNVFLEII